MFIYIATFNNSHKEKHTHGFQKFPECGPSTTAALQLEGAQLLVSRATVFRLSGSPKVGKYSGGGAVAINMATPPFFPQGQLGARQPRFHRWLVPALPAPALRPMMLAALALGARSSPQTDQALPLQLVRKKG